MMKTTTKILLLPWISLLLIFSACEPDYTPKRRGFHRIDLPSHEYKPLSVQNLPYTFEQSQYATAARDTFGIVEKDWINLYYPDFEAEVQITYKHIKDDPMRLYEMINDAHKLTSKHQIKAYAIDELLVPTRQGNQAYVFKLQGEVPSQFQFYITDTTQHFLRGALYFRTATQNDSLAPVIDFIEEDMLQLLNTLQWQGC